MNVIQILTKLGYEISSINEDILPATISLNGQPLGFLLSDLSTSLVNENTDIKTGIDNAIEFAKTYNGLQVVNDEFKLSAYENTLITASFDFDKKAPVFNVYSVSNGEYTLLNSSYEKSQATNFFAKSSGLTNPQVSDNKQIGRINAFVEQIKKLGYEVNHTKEPNKIYTITDRDNNEVGYINSQYRFTLSTDTIATRRELNQAFDVTSPNKSLSPPFFERLKQALTQLKLSLKIIFTRQGEKYVINDNHTHIATIDEDKNVQFANKVSEKTQMQLTNMIQTIKTELSNPLDNV